MIIEIIVVILGFGLFFTLGYIIGRPSDELLRKSLLTKKQIVKIIDEHLQSCHIKLITLSDEVKKK